MVLRLSAAEAKERIVSGDAPAGIVVDDDDVLDLSDTKICELPERLRCYELDASNTRLQTLPASLKVECSLRLQRCHALTKLPAGLTVGTLDVFDCRKLTQLPERLSVWFLNAGNCRGLESFPKRADFSYGGVSVADCEKLTELPAYLGGLATLDISGCPQIDRLPDSLRVHQWIDIADSGITERTPQIERCQIRWRGVPIDDTTAFRPERLTAKACLKEANAEIRRVMIERMGFDRFVEDADGRRLDQDTDPGGKRELLRVPLEGDEDIVCLSCNCPSTGRHYLLRVPPKITTCRAAAAWMAGFDDPRLYRPVIET